MKDATRWAIVAVTSGCAFAVLFVADHVGAMDPIDQRVSNWLDTHDPDRFDPVARAIAVLGETSIVGVATIALAVFLWRRGPRLGWMAPSVVAITGVAEIVFKLPLFPPPSLGQYLQATADALAGLEVGHSFPSGHVARVACLALIAGSLSSRFVWRLGAAAMIAGIFVARTYAGGHTIADTLGGLALGLSAGSAGVGWLRWRQHVEERASALTRAARHRAF